MTDITPLIPRGSLVIAGYGAGFVRINGQVYKDSVVVGQNRVVPWGGTWDDLLVLSDVDIILLGTGRTLSPLPKEIRMLFREKSINIEAMDTGSVCRTYNVLMAEGRRVVAVLTRGEE